MSDNPKHGESCHDFTQRMLREADDKPTGTHTHPVGQPLERTPECTPECPQPTGLTDEQITNRWFETHPSGHISYQQECGIFAFVRRIEAVVRKDERERACRRIDALWPVAKGLAKKAKDAILRDDK